MPMGLSTSQRVAHNSKCASVLLALYIEIQGMAEIAGVDNDGVNRRGGHCRSGQ